MAGGLPSYMVVRGAARDVKLRRLTNDEKFVWFMGILSLAAGEPRGYLRVGTEDLPDDQAAAEAAAYEAGADVENAVRAIQKLKTVGCLIDTDQGLYVTKWSDHQYAPKHQRPSDAPAETRARKQRSRAENQLLEVPAGGTRQRDREKRELWIAELAAEMYPGVDDPLREAGFVKQALGSGCRTKKDIRAYVEPWIAGPRAVETPKEAVA
jgi:hypothetical protein